MPVAYIGLGGNVGDVRARFATAIPQIATLLGGRLIARSGDYETPPWGVEDQPPFVNACIAVETSQSPQGILAALQGLERQFGRDRSVETRWGPRTLDLDLLHFGTIVLDAPDLQIPHPRMTERAFVLVPLAEIAPDLIVAGKPVSEHLASLSAVGIRRLPPAAGTS